MGSDQEYLSGSTLATKPSTSFSSTSTRSAGSKLLFGEIDSSSDQSFTSFRSACTLILSSNSSFTKFWINDGCRDALLEHLPRSDLATMRLVCHDFSEKTAPLVFENLSISFRASTFSRPAKLAALDRIGHHVKGLRFSLPRTLDTLLPPLIDPWTGEERDFVWKPQTRHPVDSGGGGKAQKQPRYGDWETTDLLVRQYPTLFHAATNITAFIRAFSAMKNLRHLHVGCPEDHGTVPQQQRMDIVEHALLSIRIAVERSRIHDLDSLTLSPIRETDVLYLSPLLSAGTSPNSAKSWSRIRSLSIDMTYGPRKHDGHSGCQKDTLKLLQTYISSFKNLHHFSFRWLGGEKGPSPLPQTSLSRFTETQNIHPSCRSRNQHPALRSLPSPKTSPPYFPSLETLRIRNAILSALEIAILLKSHQSSLREMDLEDVSLTNGTWDDALGVLVDDKTGRRRKGNDDDEDVLHRKREDVEVGDVPIMLGNPSGFPPTSSSSSSPPFRNPSTSSPSSQPPRRTETKTQVLLDKDNGTVGAVRKILLLGPSYPSLVTGADICILPSGDLGEKGEEMRNKEKDRKKKKGGEKGWAGERIRRACGGILGWRV